MYIKEVGIPTIAQAKVLEQYTLAQAYSAVLAWHRGVFFPEEDRALLEHPSCEQMGRFLKRLRYLWACGNLSPLFHDMALATFVGANVAPALKLAVDGFTPPKTTIDLFGKRRKEALEGASSWWHFLQYCVRHPHIVWNAFLSTHMGASLFGRMYPFDPRGRAFNTSGLLWSENMAGGPVMDWVVGPTPSLGDQIAPEMLVALSALQLEEKRLFTHRAWVYVNLQNIRSHSERDRSSALFRLSRAFPDHFRLASITVDAPFYKRTQKEADHRSIVLEELKKAIEEKPSWYAFSLRDDEKERWWRAARFVVREAFQLGGTDAKVFHELVVLGLIRAWQAFCVGNRSGRVISTVACKECADRGGSVNAAFLWARQDGDEAERAREVMAILWGRPLLARRRLNQEHRTHGFEALVRALAPETVRAFLQEVWVFSRMERKAK